MAVCRACGHDNPEGARFCNGCGTPFESVAPEQPREERKVVSIVFADLVGSTARAESLDPEDVRAVLSPYHELLRRELEAIGGTVEKFIGDAVVAVFGAPVAHEDDAERAVRASLAIQEAIADLNEAEPGLELEVRIGVNTGEALVDLGARPELGEGMVSGDVINTAARLQSAAPPGGVLVGEQTHRATARVIEFADHAPIDARGKAEPVACWLVVSARSSFGLEDDAVGHAPLVGRAREVSLLADALARVRSDERPQLVTLVGVPGIGKSRLVHELRHIVDVDAELITWRRGRSLPYGEGISYWALGEIVKAQAGILESDSADAAATKLDRAVGDLAADQTEAAWLGRQLRPLVGLPGEGAAPSRAESFAAWRRFLESLAEHRPAVLVFEDLHWADDDLLDFIDELTDEADAVPLLVVCTARPELLARRPGWGGGKLNAATLSLSPLTDEETARLLAVLLGRTLIPAETQSLMIARAEGVPLFAEEYARMLDADGGGERELPDTLQGLVAARIDGLPQAAKALLQDASVLGKVFWSDALSVLTGLDDAALDDALRQLERREFVRRERRSAVEGARQYAFLHALVRDVAYGQIPRAGRSRKHRATAAWIAGLSTDRADDFAETLVHHLDSAVSLGNAAGLDVADLQPALARALEDAGDRVWALGAVARAAEFYRRAMEVSDAPTPELILHHAHARLWADGVAGGSHVLEAAVPQLLAAGRPDLAAQALTLLYRAHWLAGEAIPDLLERALDLVADSGPTPTRSRVISEVAVLRAIAGHAAEALPLAREAVEIARMNGNREAESEALNNLSVVYANLGDTEEAVATGRESLAVGLECGSSDLTRLYTNLATYEFDRGNLEEARTYHRDGLALALRTGNVASVDWLRVEQVLDAYEVGEWDEARADTLLAEHAAAQVEHYMDANLLLVDASITFGRTGRLEVDALNDALRRARAVGDPQLRVPTVAWSALLFERAGLSAEARASLDDLESLFDTPAAFGSSGLWSLQAAVVWLEHGRPLTTALSAGPDSPWRRATRLLASGQPAAAADLLAQVGARTMEAEVRMHAARAGGPDALDQLDSAAQFWSSVRAEARLAEVERVRSTLNESAS